MAKSTKLPEIPTLNSIAQDQKAEYDAVYKMLADEVNGTPIASEHISALNLLGDEQGIRHARAIVRKAMSAIGTMAELEGAAAQAEAARSARDTKVPKLREQIARIESEIRELEDAPRVYEAQARQYDGAVEQLYSAIPIHIKRMHLERMKQQLYPLEKEYNAKKHELFMLNTWLQFDPYDKNPDNVRLFKNVKDAKGERPWVITEERGAWMVQSVDVGALNAFLQDEDIAGRVAALEPVVDELKQRVDTIEAEIKSMIPQYWDALLNPDD